MAKKASQGKTRMKQLGHVEVTLWFTPEELAVIEAAAKIDRKKRATWIRDKAYQLAQVTTQRARISDTGTRVIL